ncbi:U-box domain-containing protein [Zostera marina]|uniref:U-box domain-containing protein n=1 Tax=Zostera marina TaxID=29655 RepID=A0A0K9PMJ3_ZOSMR|nr:U-box domain-containing protein [Zostera marina]
MINSMSTSEDVVEILREGDEESRLAMAREIRRLTKTSASNRRYLSDAIDPLVSMLQSGCTFQSNEAVMLALLNLAVKDERNKIKIVEAGALQRLTNFLQSSNQTLQEYATATILTLTASPINKPIINSTGTVIPILIGILDNGSTQAKTDAVIALYNLSTIPENLHTILSLHPIPLLVNIIGTCKKLSKIVEKSTALIESLLPFDQARADLTNLEGGVLAVVEILEGGTLQGREHAVGALLTMCEIDRCKYRQVILNEGAIPGLLELTVQGTTKSRSKARKLLQLLRNSPYPQSEVDGDTLENIVCNIVSQIDGEEKAKKILADMVHVSMEQSLLHLQQRFLLRPSITAQIPTTE